MKKSNRSGEEISERNTIGGPKPVDMKQNKQRKNRNMQRLGGKSGLSLAAFANAKSAGNHYNPAIIKKKREFYKNAKVVRKFKRMNKQQGQQDDVQSNLRIQEESQDRNEVGDHGRHDPKKRKKKSQSLTELYEQQRAEKEKARIEKEALMQAKKEARERAEAQRKAAREKMFKKTKFGQPVMKYRIEHLLQTIQSSASNEQHNQQ